MLGIAQPRTAHSAVSFAAVCNRFGDVERCALRQGNVGSVDGWRALLDPMVARSRDREAFLFPRRSRAQGLHDPAARQPRLAGQDRLLSEASGRRPPRETRRHFASLTCQAQSWSKPRRVVSKVE
jgi:hypothetical protein